MKKNSVKSRRPRCHLLIVKWIREMLLAAANPQQMFSRNIFIETLATDDTIAALHIQSAQ